MTRSLRPGVVDTNVAVSALLAPASSVGQSLESFAVRRKLICSLETLAELEAVWMRPKFNRYGNEVVRRKLRFNFMARFALIPVNLTIQACRDPRDDKFLELAVSGGADLILTGDADLLALHPFRGIAILSPAAYLASVDTGS